MLYKVVYTFHRMPRPCTNLISLQQPCYKLKFSICHNTLAINYVQHTYVHMIMNHLNIILHNYVAIVVMLKASSRELQISRAVPHTLGIHISTYISKIKCVWNYGIVNLYMLDSIMYILVMYIYNNYYML